MSKRSDDAPALAGWAGNPNVPLDQRLAAAAHALNFYVDTHDRLHKLREYCEQQRTGNPNADQAITWGHAGALVEKILNDEHVDEFDRLERALNDRNGERER